MGEVVNLINTTRQVMKEQRCNPREIAIEVEGICKQYNVKLPEFFVKPEKTTMNDINDMIDFIFSKLHGRGQKKPTYEEFIITQTTIKRLNG